VIQQKKRLLIRAGTEARVNRLACWIRSNQRRLDAALDQELLQKASARRLVPRRVRCVDAKVIDKRVFRFVINGVRVGACRSPAVQRNDEKEKRHREEKSGPPMRRNHPAT
jgi:hypothetical protein